MRYLFIGILFLGTMHLTAQDAPAQEQPVVAFPFGIDLYTTDSTKVSSDKVLASKGPTLIAFWLTTCFPCSNELDAYSANYEAWKKAYNLEIVAVSMDFADKFRRIEQRVNEKKYPFPVYWDRIRAFKGIMPGGLNGYPQIFLFDKKGQLVWQKKGYLSGDEQKMIEQVKALDNQN